MCYATTRAWSIRCWYDAILFYISSFCIMNSWVTRRLGKQGAIQHNGHWCQLLRRWRHRRNVKWHIQRWVHELNSTEALPQIQCHVLHRCETFKNHQPQHMYEARYAVKLALYHSAWPVLCTITDVVAIYSKCHRLIFCWLYFIYSQIRNHDLQPGSFAKGNSFLHSSHAAVETRSDIWRKLSVWRRSYDF